MLTPEEQAQLDEQVALSKSLAFGCALSLLPAGGVGSILAIAIGVRGKKKIDASGGRLTGRGMAIWCISVGTAGLLLSIGWLLTSLFPK